MLCACQPDRPASQCRAFTLFIYGRCLLSLADLADRHVKSGQAERLALRWRGRNGRKREFTYGDLADLSTRLAGHMLAEGIKPGDSVGVLSGRQPETVIAALAISWLTKKASSVVASMSMRLLPRPSTSTF